MIRSVITWPGLTQRSAGLMFLRAWWISDALLDSVMCWLSEPDGILVLWLRLRCLKESGFKVNLCRGDKPTVEFPPISREEQKVSAVRWKNDAHSIDNHAGIRSTSGRTRLLIPEGCTSGNNCVQNLRAEWCSRSRVRWNGRGQRGH